MIEGILRNNVVLVLIILIASGCTSLRPLPDEKNALEHAVKPGDKVYVITRDGQEMEFLVTQIANERIEGPRQYRPRRRLAWVLRFAHWQSALPGIPSLAHRG